MNISLSRKKTFAKNLAKNYLQDFPTPINRCNSLDFIFLRIILECSEQIVETRCYNWHHQAYNNIKWRYRFSLAWKQAKIHIFSLICRNQASDYSIKIHELFDARHSVKKLCQTWDRLFIGETTRCHVWHRFLTPWLALKSSDIFML